WIDLGCPIDLDPTHRHGWLGDDQRPTLTLTYPKAGANAGLTRLVLGMHDAYGGLDIESFEVVADFAVDWTPAGGNPWPLVAEKAEGVWELKLARPMPTLPKGQLTVSVKDRQGNTSRIERTFSVNKVGE